MQLPLFIAGRYLFARKSHNVINIISAVSALGMTVGTAALIIILSVYNGFNSMVESMLRDTDPELAVFPAKGKVFIPDGEVWDVLYQDPRVKSICTVLQENVYISYDGKQGMALARGVDGIWEEEELLEGHILDGKYGLHKGEIPLACVGAGLAYRMGINPRFLSGIDLWFPSRTAKVSLSNPLAGLEMVTVWPSCIFSISSEADDKVVILPIEQMRELLDYDDEVSTVEIRLADDISERDVKEVRSILEMGLPDTLVVRDRHEQNESLFRMMKYEKAAIWLILFFVVIIIAFNVFGSLTMLILEKKEDIGTLRSIGAPEGLIKRTFLLEGWLISLLGMAAGLVIGLAVCFLQQRFGFVKMPVGFVTDSYPVVVRFADVAMTAAGVALVGLVVAMIPVVAHFRKDAAIMHIEN